MLFNKFLDFCKKNIIWAIALGLAIALFLTSTVMLLVHIVPRKNSYEQYVDMSQIKIPETKPVSSETSSGEVSETPPPTSEPIVNPVDFAALIKQNPDVCGWIVVEGTPINYPILRSGADKTEDFYLDHDLNAREKKQGSIYIQRLNSADFSDANTIIYGHNMMNGSMFGTLKRFRDANFFNENDDIAIYLTDRVLKYKICSAVLFDDRHILNSFNCNTARGMEAYINAITKPQTSVKNVRKGIELSLEDKLITLSTCTSKDSERYLVIGVLTEEIRTK